MEQALGDGIGEVESWTLEWFGGHFDIWQESSGCSRAVYRLAMIKTEYLRRIPYKLARILEPGMKEILQAQYRSAPRAAHHYASVEMFDGIYAGDLAAYAPPEEDASPQLKQAVRRIQLIPWTTASTRCRMQSLPAWLCIHAMLLCLGIVPVSDYTKHCLALGCFANNWVRTCKRIGADTKP